MRAQLYGDFCKGIFVTGTHFLDLQLLQDKNCMKNKQFN